MKNLIYKIISTILSLLLVILGLFILYVSFSENSKALLGYRLFVVRTGSMSPSIEKGELIITKETPADTLKKDDVITFYSNDPQILGALNTHRIFEVQEAHFITKGDANGFPDEYPVSYSKIIGKVVFHNGVIGKVVLLLKNPACMLMLIIIPVLLVSLTDITKTSIKIRRIFSNEPDEENTADTEEDKEITQDIKDESKEADENSTEDNS